MASGRVERSPNAWSFRPIFGARAHEEVVDQITFAIRAGIFRPGDRLPRIEDLARQMGVSKPTISEALRVLSGGGVVEVQRGATGGVVVRSHDVPVTLMRMAAGGRAAALSHLVEARRPVEMELAMLAAKRATPEDIETLKAAVEGLRELQLENGDGDGLMRYDAQFHYGMGRAARSEVLWYQQHQILEQLALLRLDYYKQADPEAALAVHGETLAAIASRDLDQVEDVMDRHLAGLERLADEWDEEAAAG